MGRRGIFLGARTSPPIGQACQSLGDHLPTLLGLIHLLSVLQLLLENFLRRLAQLHRVLPHPHPYNTLRTCHPASFLLGSESGFPITHLGARG